MPAVASQLAVRRIAFPLLIISISPALPDKLVSLRSCLEFYFNSAPAVIVAQPNRRLNMKKLSFAYFSTTKTNSLAAIQLKQAPYFLGWLDVLLTSCRATFSTISWLWKKLAGVSLTV